MHTCYSTPFLVKIEPKLYSALDWARTPKSSVQCAHLYPKPSMVFLRSNGQMMDKKSSEANFFDPSAAEQALPGQGECIKLRGEALGTG